MTIPLSVTVRDWERGAVRTFITEVDGNPDKPKDRDKALQLLFQSGAPEVVDGVDIVWAPAAIVRVQFID